MHRMCRDASQTAYDLCRRADASTRRTQVRFEGTASRSKQHVDIATDHTKDTQKSIFRCEGDNASTCPPSYGRQKMFFNEWLSHERDNFKVPQEPFPRLPTLSRKESTTRSTMLSTESSCIAIQTAVLARLEPKIKTRHHATAEERI